MLLIIKCNGQLKQQYLTPLEVSLTLFGVQPSTVLHNAYLLMI